MQGLGGRGEGDVCCEQGVNYLQGDVGRVMYIVSKGILKVLGGSNGKEVLAELGPGSAFGEIR